MALGGGSSIGLSKALALRTGLPQVVVPTTYAGSEATPILGQTEGSRKTTLRSDAVLPRAIVYDVGLTLTLPAKLSATSGAERHRPRSGSPVRAGREPDHLHAG